MLLLRRMLKNKLLNWNLLRNKYKELFLLIIIFINVILVYSATFTTITQGDFDNGTYNNTYYNTTHNFTQLNITSFYSGNYTSKIFSAGSTSQWNNISWISNAIGELPNNGANEITLNTFGSGNINMTGNVLLMHFNNDTGENSTFFRDWSGIGNNGTCSGTACPALTSSGKLNNAYDFDTTDDKITITNGFNSIQGDDSHTVSLWVNIDTLSQKVFFGTSLSQYYFQFNNGNGVYIQVGAPYRTYTTKTLSTGKWYHFTFVKDGTGDSGSLYLDGVLQTSYTGTIASTPNSAGDILINSYSSAGYNADVKLDEVAIWNRSLSASEVLDLYERGATRLNLSVRSCDDSACAGEDFAGTYNTSVSNLSIANNSFFQYRAFFETDNLSVSPELYNVSVDYTVLDATSPNVNFSSTTVSFNFTTIDETSTSLNCTLMVSSVNKATNSSVINGTLTNLQASSLSVGSHL